MYLDPKVMIARLEERMDYYHNCAKVENNTYHKTWLQGVEVAINEVLIVVTDSIKNEP
jgi:hypothetical protein